MQKRKWHYITNEDEVKSVISFEGNIVVDIQNSSIAAIKKPRWRILGDKGGIIEDSGNLRVIKYIDGELIEEEVKADGPKYHKFYYNIADHILMGEPLEIKLEEARKVVGIIEYTYKSAKEGKPLSFE